MAVQPTIDNFMAQNTDYGSFFRGYHGAVLATTKTSANATSGYIIGKRYPDPIVLPSAFGTGITGAIPTMIQMQSNDGASVNVACLEVSLGSINMATGAFTDGSAMPSRRLVGSDTNVQTASMMTVLVSTAAVTATTPQIVITYVNQNGTGSHTATMTLPTSPVVTSTFMVTPHLQSGDTAIQDITNITKSAGSAGTITAYGLIPLAVSASQTASNTFAPDIMATPTPWISLQPSDTIAFYQFGTTTASTYMDAIVSLVADM